MRTQQIVDLLFVAALTGPASAILDTGIFKKEKVLANLVYPDYFVLYSTADTVIECGNVCLREKSCTSFTYTRSVHSPGTCHGYFRINLENTNTKSTVGASTYVMKSVQCDVCTNIAVNKPATQHSNFPAGDPNKAVDNNIDTNFFHGSCTHTSENEVIGETHWWQVYLQDSYDIFSVNITNRDICTNIAVNKPATQHSTSFSGHPNRAVDNNTDTNYDHGFCSHTDLYNTAGETHWWQVDLQDSYDIFSVIITDRGDFIHKRLRDFDISVYNEDPVTQPGATSTLCYHYDGVMELGSTKQFNCYRNPIRGQIVRITNHPELVLTLCEVQVMAVPVQ